MKRYKFDLFGIKRRRAERQALEEARNAKIKSDRQKVYDVRKTIIDDFLKLKYNYYRELAWKDYDKDRAKVKEKNQVCPICKSKNRIDKFLRIQGSLNGHSLGSGSFSGGLFYNSGNYTHSGSIEGHLDTYVVNECKDCGNQWAKAEPKHAFVSDYDINPYDIHDGNVGYLYRRIIDAISKNEIKEHSILKNSFSNVDREVIEYLLYKYDSENGYKSTYFDSKLFGIPIIKDENDEHFNNDPYLFVLTDEIWDIVKMLIGKK